jgi:hypothetical protein
MNAAAERVSLSPDSESQAKICNKDVSGDVTNLASQNATLI